MTSTAPDLTYTAPLTASITLWLMLPLTTFTTVDISLVSFSSDLYCSSHRLLVISWPLLLLARPLLHLSRPLLLLSLPLRSSCGLYFFSHGLYCSTNFLLLDSSRGKSTGTYEIPFTKMHGIPQKLETPHTDSMRWLKHHMLIIFQFRLTRSLTGNMLYL